jgi:outer membrane usher protein
MSWCPTRYRWPAWLAAVVVAGATGSALAQPAQAPSDAAGLLGQAPAGQDAGLAGYGGDASLSYDSQSKPPLHAPEAGSASQPPNSAPDEGHPAFFVASVNQVEIGDVLVILRGDDVLMKVSDLEKSGMHVEGGRREKNGEDPMVSLRSLTPKVTFVLDERSLTLTLTADSSLFGGSTLDLRAKRPEGIIYDNATSLFVNYSVGRSELQSPDQSRWNGFAETGLSVRGHLLYTSGQLSATDGSWDRLLTHLTLDLRDRLTSIVLGDVNSSSDALGGGGMLGGVSVARNFGLDPYFVFLPTQQLSGTALTPSMVEVYVNGQLVHRETLAPGQFNLQNLPLTSGRGETRVVIRDAFGATQSVVSPYYLALGTLAKGLHDFSYNLGFKRRNFGSESWSYGQPALLFRHRFGLTNWLTVGYRAEGTQDMVSGGPSLALRLPIGELGAAAAVSGQDSFAGGAALLSFSYMGQPLNFQVGLRYQSKEYATLNQAPYSLPPPNALPKDLPSSSRRSHLDLTASLARNIGKVAALSLQYQGVDWRDEGWENRIMLGANRSLTRWMYAFATVTNTYRRAYSTEYSTFVGLSFAPAERVTAGITRSDHTGGQSAAGGTTQVSVQQSLPLGPGVGYRVVASQGENALNQATAQVQGGYGRIEADYQHQGYGRSDRGHASLTATGGLVLIGGDVYLTRPVQDSYALIRVPGVAGVHGTMSNQVMGTTNRKGDLLIPSLLHYYGNRVGIDDKDIPLDHDIGTTEKIIAPPFRGGAIVSFPVRRVLSVAGTVVIDNQGSTILPTYGQFVVKVGQQQVVSPLDEAGNFYLENVSPGTYAAEVQYEAGQCNLPLLVPAGSTALVNVGTIRCILPKKETK